MKKYITKLNDKNCIEMSKPISTILVYKFPYKAVKSKNHDIEISNRFIVYILFGRNKFGKDVIYVGKSKNGIDHRPTSHEDKYDSWTDCYVITDIKERTILNDGTIQYLEDKICNQINDTNNYINKTIQTTAGIANHSDMEDCDEFLKEACDMLYALGLDLISASSDNNEKQIEPGTAEADVAYTIKPKMMNLYQQLVKAVKDLNSEIIFTPMKHYIKATIGQNHLFDVRSNKDCLGIYLNAKKGTLIDNDNLLEDIQNVGHLGNGDYRITINTDERLTEIIDFINQVINL